MQYVSFIQGVDVFSGNDIDLLIPVLIKCFQCAELFDLSGRELRKTFQENLHGGIKSSSESVDARGPGQR